MSREFNDKLNLLPFFGCMYKPVRLIPVINPDYFSNEMPTIFFSIYGFEVYQYTGIPVYQYTGRNTRCMWSLLYQYSSPATCVYTIIYPSHLTWTNFRWANDLLPSFFLRRSLLYQYNSPAPCMYIIIYPSPKEPNL